MQKTIISLALAALLAGPLSAFANILPASAASINTAVRGQSQQTVYWYANDGKRYVFPNAATYFTWFTSFDNVQNISDSELFAIPLAGNVTYRPGAKLVKVTTDPKVYAVARGGILRHVTSEYLATQLYGSNWAAQVQDVPDTYFTNYNVGSPIYSTSDYNVSNEYNGVSNPGDSLRTAGQNFSSTMNPCDSHPFPNPDYGLKASKTSIHSGDAVELCVYQYVVTSPIQNGFGNSHIDIIDQRTGAIAHTCYTIECRFTINPIRNGNESSVTYTEGGPYHTPSSDSRYTVTINFTDTVSQGQSGSLSFTADRTSISNGQAVYLTASYNGTLPSGGYIDIRDLRSNNVVKTCYNASVCNMTVFPYVDSQTGTAQYFAAARDANGTTIANQYSQVIYLNGTSNQNGNGTLTMNADRTNITSGQSVNITADYNANIPSGGRIDIKELRNNTVVKSCYNASSCSASVSPYQSGYSSTQYSATVYDASGNQITTQYGPTIYFDGSSNQNSNVTVSLDRSSITSGQAVTITANYNASLTNGRIEIMQEYPIGTVNIVKTCYNTNTCSVTVYPNQISGYSNQQQYRVNVVNSSGLQVASGLSAMITFTNTSSNALTLVSDLTTVTSGNAINLIAQSTRNSNSGHINIINQQTGALVSNCYNVSTCTQHVTVTGSNGQSVRFTADWIDNSGAIVDVADVTIYISSSNTGPASNDGTNYINGLTLQADRTSLNSGDRVHLTANAFNTGNWNYTGNRIEIRDIRTGSTVATCRDASWCVTDVNVTGSNGTAQYEARIYDRNGNFVMSQMGPVIYVNGTSSNNNISNTYAGQITYPTNNQVLSNYPRNLTVRWNGTTRRAQLEVTCVAPNPCYAMANGGANITASVYTDGYTNSADMVMTGDNSYSARVRSINDDGSSGPWSDYVYFSYRTGGYVAPTNSVGQIPNTDMYIAPTYNIHPGVTVYLTASFTNLSYATANTVIRVYMEGNAMALGSCTGSTSCSVPYTIPSTGSNTRVYGVASNTGSTNMIETARIPLVSN